MPKLTPEQERERASWQYRLIDATQGNRSMMGCLVQAVIGRAASNPPTMGMTGLISVDGFVFTNFLDSKRRLHAAAPEAVFPPLCIGTIIGVRDELRYLADHCQLTDAEREAFFEEFRKWISHDFRAITDPDQQVV